MQDQSLSRRDLLASATVVAVATRAPQAFAAPHSRRTSALRLGLVTYNLAATWDLPTLLRIAANTEIRDLELRTTHGHAVEPSLTLEQRREVKARFDDSPVRLWGLGSVCEFHSPERAKVDENVETCKRFLELAADLGAHGVKVRPNGLPREVPVEKTLDQIGQALRQCGETAAALNRELWVEVHGAGTAEPRHMKAIMERCGHPSVGITWNSNPQDVKNGSVAESFALLKPWLRSVHINELYRGYPYRELFHLLMESGYDRPTLIEIPQKLEPASGELLLRYYKALWTELQRPMSTG